MLLRPVLTEFRVYSFDKHFLCPGGGWCAVSAVVVKGWLRSQDFLERLALRDQIGNPVSDNRDHARRMGPQGTQGNSGRNTIIGPNLWSMDNSLNKDFRVPQISEQFKIQFRAEFFNSLNHPTFRNPFAALYVNCPNATCPADPRARPTVGHQQPAAAGSVWIKVSVLMWRQRW